MATLNDAAEVARVHVATWKEAYAGILSDDFLKSISFERWLQLREENIKESNAADSGKAYLIGCDDEGAIRGFVAGGKNRSSMQGFDAELYAAYVLPSFQRQGIGNSLVLALTDWLIGQNFNAMCCWILRDNPARQFYETVGGKRQEATREMEIGGKKYPAVCYGWRDLRALKSLLLF